MQTVKFLAELREARRSLTGIFGLVPTMGALHEGHISLISQAKRECDRVGVSVFVNPTQFGPHEDFGAYPRNLERDLRLLESAGADLVWTPAPESVYPKGFQTWVTVDELSAPLEGEARPGHFRGVATIVAKLFHAFMPDRAYFGQKDAQQSAVIRRMVHDLDFPVAVVVCPTVREIDGLAMSSRNAYLSSDERRAATVLHRALLAAKRRYDDGARGAEELREALRSTIREEPLPREEYVSAADPETLAELDRVDERVLLSLAVRIGRTRLIDNILLS
jgi:pantoate--beta-alanine ligase